MTRIPRKLVLEEGCQTHKMWRGHNRESNIASNDERETYLNQLNRELKKESQSNELNAYSLMPNHTHEIFNIIDKIQFSNLMRNHHSQYGLYFNRKHNRQGKVAYERPKTCLIQDDNYSMTATFYIHANPLKAGIVKNAANYKWSTHNLYAFGKKDKFMKYVRFPHWYMNLGKSWQERQKNYRKLFDAYLREVGLIKLNFVNHRFYGNPLWMLEMDKKIADWAKKLKAKDPP